MKIREESDDRLKNNHPRGLALAFVLRRGYLLQGLSELHRPCSRPALRSYRLSARFRCCLGTDVGRIGVCLLVKHILDSPLDHGTYNGHDVWTCNL